MSECLKYQRDLNYKLFMQKRVFKYLLSLLFLGLVHMQLSGQVEESDSSFVQFFYPNNQVSSEGLMRNGKPAASPLLILLKQVLKSSILHRSSFLSAM